MYERAQTNSVKENRPGHQEGITSKNLSTLKWSATSLSSHLPLTTSLYFGTVYLWSSWLQSCLMT